MWSKAIMTVLPIMTCCYCYGCTGGGVRGYKKPNRWELGTKQGNSRLATGGHCYWWLGKKTSAWITVQIHPLTSTVSS